MIEIDEALARVLSRCGTCGTVLRSVVDAVGYVLAEDISSDVDSPPHDKALVDGYAVCVADVRAGRELRVGERVLAGDVPTRAVRPGTASHVMTGAPIPPGTEAMIMVEQTERVGDGGQAIRILTGDVRPGQFIMRRATSFAREEVVLRRGTLLRPPEIGLLGEVGREEVLCRARPAVAILSTGDELVPVSAVPEPGHIRNSNGPMIEACVRQAGAQAIGLGVAGDDETELRQQIARGLAYDVLVVSGGVSAGVRDLVPGMLKSLGVEQVFHKVRLKPGKPLWFGCGPDGDRAGRTLVFGLPGNPVSSLVCFQFFVRPALRALAGEDPQNDAEPGRLTAPFTHRGSRPTFYPARLSRAAGGVQATPLPWHGSSDMRSFARAQGLIFFPAGDQDYAAGDQVDVFPLG